MKPKTAWDEALDLIMRLHDELIAEHDAIPANWLGQPRRRHHEIMGASRALKKLHKQLCDAEVAEARRELDEARRAYSGGNPFKEGGWRA